MQLILARRYHAQLLADVFRVAGFMVELLE